jgi:lipopolysaccharide transport protein LptA
MMGKSRTRRQGDAAAEINCGRPDPGSWRSYIRRSCELINGAAQSHALAYLFPRALLLVSLFLCLEPGPAAAEPFAKLGSDAADTNSTVITSTRLNFDQQKRMAIFEEHVVVTDPRVKITADKLTVLFSEDNKVTAIEAEGNVVIREEEKKATGARARYEVAEGKFVLTGHPMVQSGRDVLSADIITFWRNTNRIQCEPNARLVIRSEQAGFDDSLPKKER